MEIYVKALPVEEILIDLSEKLDLPIERDAGELCLNLPREIGYGFIRGSSFPSGLGIIEYYCTFFKDLRIHFSANKIHPLKFIFCSKGKINHAFENEENPHTIDTYQNAIVSSAGHNGHVMYFNANETVHVCSLEIIRDKFSLRNNYNFEGLDSNLKNLFEENVAKDVFFYQGNYSIELADIVEEINKKSQTGFLRSIFLEAKVYEMLTKQIIQYQTDQNSESLPFLTRQSDVEKVKQAVKIIKKEMNRNFSVNYLAKEVGTNVNKLQEAFKHMFGLTVNKYMQQVKLEAAKELLMTTDHNISQIVSMIGLSNRSYFSKVFKEKYGVSPKYFLRNHNDGE
ncbi:helix-turn-helix domain-containing protein [Salinimicrobium gaetbulicola]|uniref:Helix-turn-helix domain-containing protein n=1 Tax=Salinimicrobium gaetbulicola TaxID=999702 RepID=A0ABW3IDN0_9FLAO